MMESYEVLDAQIDRALLRQIDNETAWAPEKPCDELEYDHAVFCLESVRCMIDLTEEIKGFIAEMQLAEIRERRKEAAEEVKALRAVLGKDREEEGAQEEQEEQDAQTAQAQDAGNCRQQEEG